MKLISLAITLLLVQLSSAQAFQPASCFEEVETQWGNKNYRYSWQYDITENCEKLLVSSLAQVKRQNLFVNLLRAKTSLKDKNGVRELLSRIKSLKIDSRKIYRDIYYAKRILTEDEEMKRLADKSMSAAQSIREENEREWARRERALKEQEALAAAEEKQAPPKLEKQVAANTPAEEQQAKEQPTAKITPRANLAPKVTALRGKRIALIIGNDNYSNLPPQFQLKKARNDARSTAETFKSLGFDVAHGFDLDRRDLNIQLASFGNRIEPGDEVMFFFAGHGVRIDGRNYLLPSDIPDINSANQDLLKSEAIRIDRISDMLRSKGARLALLVIDACRNNPYKDTRGRSIGGSRGLAPMDPPEGTLVLFSAGAGQQALDRLSDTDVNPNSIFTRTFLPLVKQQGLELSRLSRLVKRKVRDLAKTVGHSQTPAVYNEVIGDVYLATN